VQNNRIVFTSNINMIEIKKIAPFIFLSLTILSCGGGGGGGSSTVNTGYRVLHAALDLRPLQIRADSGEPVSVKYASKVSFIELNEGEHTLIADENGPNGAELLNSNFTLKESERVSFLVEGTANENETNIVKKVVEPERPELESGKSALKIVNSAVGSQTASLFINNREVINAVSNGSSSDYRTVDSGNLPLRVIAANRSVLFSDEVTLEEGNSYTLFIAGETGLYSQGILLRD
jgi:hypothetical protein